MFFLFEQDRGSGQGDARPLFPSGRLGGRAHRGHAHAPSPGSAVSSPTAGRCAGRSRTGPAELRSAAATATVSGRADAQSVEQLIRRATVSIPATCGRRSEGDVQRSTGDKKGGTMPRLFHYLPFPAPARRPSVAVLADSTSATSLEEVEVGAGVGAFDMLLVQPKA